MKEIVQKASITVFMLFATVMFLLVINMIAGVFGM
jgi:cell division protein FtsX